MSEPETFVSDYHNIAENISEFHIIALEDGNGEMVFQCVKDDGSTDMYTLGLSISRHQKTNLQIDSITFKISGCLKQGMEEKLTETAKEPRKMRKEIYKEWQSILPALLCTKTHNGNFRSMCRKICS